MASHRENLPKMGAAGTIPDECLFAACTIARDSLPAMRINLSCLTEL